MLGATVVQRWFYLHRGLALGLLTASSATGQLVFLPVLAQLVVSSGWRWAVIVVAGVALLIAPITFLVMRDRPQEKGLTPLGLPDTETVPAPATGNPFVAAIGALRMASRTREFWILAGSFFICGASTNGLIGTHLIPACMDHGIPEVQAAGLLAMMGIFDLVGTTGSGWLSDRLRQPYVADDILRPAGPGPALPPLWLRLRESRTVPLRRVLWPRLDCHRAARPSP